MGARRVGARKVVFFLFPLLLHFRFFFSLRGFSRGVVAAGRGHGPPKLCVWAFLGHFCVSPCLLQAAEIYKMIPGPQTRYLGGLSQRPAATIQREDLPREKQRERKREKKSDISGGPGEGGPGGGRGSGRRKGVGGKVGLGERGSGRGESGRRRKTTPRQGKRKHVQNRKTKKTERKSKKNKNTL